MRVARRLRARWGHWLVLARLGQAALSASTAWVLGRMTEDLTGSRRAGRAALMVAAVYPFFIYYSGMLLFETVYLAVSSVGLWGMWLARRRWRHLFPLLWFVLAKARRLLEPGGVVANLTRLLNEEGFVPLREQTALKTLTPEYIRHVLEAYDSVLGRLAGLLTGWLPAGLARAPLVLPTGEILVYARKAAPPK